MADGINIFAPSNISFSMIPRRDRSWVFIEPALHMYIYVENMTSPSAVALDFLQCV